MNGARRVTLSLTTFVLISFFLPWVQLSCVSVKDSVSGFDFAREGDSLLWLVPLFMLLILILGLVRLIWEKVPAMFALSATVGGSITAYLMYREYSSTNDSARLLLAQWTPWFWLSFAASLGIVAAALVFYAKRSRSP